MAPPPPPPPSQPSTTLPPLMEDVVERILLRIPPNDPALLFRAAAVCKAWSRLICSPGFRRRFREFHRGATGAPPPLLGLIYRRTAQPVNGVKYTRFLPTSSSTFRLASSSPSTTAWHAMDTLHGRMLFSDSDGQDPPSPWNTPAPSLPWTMHFIIWSPGSSVTQMLPALSISSYWRGWSAALVCAEAGCDHLDCSGAFLVVVAGTDDKDRYRSIDLELPMTTSAHAYSSERNEWNEPVSIEHADINRVRRAGPRVGNTLYFEVSSTTLGNKDRTLLAYDLTDRRLWIDSLPHDERILHYAYVTLIAADQGRKLGFAWGMNARLWTWSRDDAAAWTLDGDFELDLPPHNLMLFYRLFAATENSGVIVVEGFHVVFTLDLNSGRITKLLEGDDTHEMDDIVPYVCFVTPDSLP